MQKTLKIGDHVRWNSEAGWVSGVVIKKLTSEGIKRRGDHRSANFGGTSTLAAGALEAWVLSGESESSAPAHSRAAEEESGVS